MVKIRARNFVDDTALLKKLKGMDRKSRSQNHSSIIVGYTQNYALYVHENKGMKLKGKPRPKNRGRFWDPQGISQPNYLRGPFMDGKKRIMARAKAIYKITSSLRLALIEAGLLLQRESQEVVPRDFGLLRASAFTEEE